MGSRPETCPFRGLSLRYAAAVLLGILATGALMLEVRAQSAPAATMQSFKLGQLVVEAPWVRATPEGAKVGAGYLNITNTGKETDRLIGGSLPVAGAVEVHEMTMTDSTMKMRKLEKGMEIKPGQTVELKPGGSHLMFIGLTESLKQGKPLKGSLVFEKAGTLEIEFAVAPIGAKSAGPMQHKH